MIYMLIVVGVGIIEPGLLYTYIWRIQPLDIKPGLVYIEQEMKGQIGFWGLPSETHWDTSKLL